MYVLCCLLRPEAELSIQRRLSTGTLQIPFMGDTIKSFWYCKRFFCFIGTLSLFYRYFINLTTGSSNIQFYRLFEQRGVGQDTSPDRYHFEGSVSIMLRHIVGQRYAGGVTQHASFEMGTPRPRTHFSGDRSVYQVSIVKKHNLSLSIHRLVRTFFYYDQIRI